MHDVAARWFASATPDGLASHGDGLGALVGFGGKALDQAHFDVLLGEVLNVGHKAFFVQAHQVNGCAVRPRAPGAADAVHIVFADVGDFVVDDVRQLIDIDTARGDVGSDQGAHITAFETGQRLRARRLAFITVQGHGADAILFQKLGHVIGTELGAREHQHLAPVLLVDDVRQQGFFLAAPDRVDHLRDALHRGVAGRDLHALRVFEQAVGQVADLVAEGGGEQQALLFFGNQRQHFFHVMDKAHVQHAISLVEHQDLHLAQIEHALLLQVQQATGRGYQNVHAFFEFADLRAHAHATKNHGAGEL